MNSKIEPTLLLPLRILPRYVHSVRTVRTRATPVAVAPLTGWRRELHARMRLHRPRSKMNGASEIREIFRLPDLSADIRGVTVHRTVRLIDAWSFTSYCTDHAGNSSASHSVDTHDGMQINCFSAHEARRD